MTIVGLAFAVVLLVWVVLDHIRQLRPEMSDVQEAITEAIGALPKPVDLTAELQTLAKKVSTIEAAAGLKRLSG